MADTLAEQLNDSALKEALLRAVANDDIDHIPSDLNDHARFVISAVRAVAARPDKCCLCSFIYSDAPKADGQEHEFERIAHMQDGQGELAGRVILTNRDAHNGACRGISEATVTGLMNELEQLSFDHRVTVIWDGTARTATVYPEGISNETNHIRYVVPLDEGELSQDEVCQVLDIIYNDNLKNPSGKTAKLWIKGKLIGPAEDEIERHIKGQMSLYFAGRARPIKILSQTHSTAGRCDLVLAQRQINGMLQLTGVVELKVLRGPDKDDIESTREGLSQGYHYRAELELPFATLALFDVTKNPSNDHQPLLVGQNDEQVAVVRVRRFPIFKSPQAWRNAQAA